MRHTILRQPAHLNVRFTVSDNTNAKMINYAAKCKHEQMKAEREYNKFYINNNNNNNRNDINIYLKNFVCFLFRFLVYNLNMPLPPRGLQHKL